MGFKGLHKEKVGRTGTQEMYTTFWLSNLVIGIYYGKERYKWMVTIKKGDLRIHWYSTKKQKLRSPLLVVLRDTTGLNSQCDFY
jgi:hypothetical protein